MTIRLYDTRAQELRDFTPLDPRNVTMYVCGPTVQSGPHIGHLRAALAFDVLRSWLVHRFGRVTMVRNVTDIDDKVLDNATAEEPWWALAYRMEQEFTAAYAAIGIQSPTYEPRATASIPQMQELIAELIDRGHAYAADGDVYFDVRSWPSYGALTHQSVDAMEDAADADPRGKRDPHDFALWKGAKPGEPSDAVWASPWGAGRPGWHMECSAMSRRYLGPEFDIHGGGLDLRFPHHENELAQSGAAGDAFARYWVHNGLVTVGGQKMSKSLGNFILADDFLRDTDPAVARYALLAAHYRSSLDISETAVAEARSALERITGFLDRAESALAHAESGDEAATGPGDGAGVPDAFGAAMDDDLGVPKALAVLHDTVRRGNTALDAWQRRSGALRDDEADVLAVDAHRLLDEASAMMSVLGFARGPANGAPKAADAMSAALDGLVRTLIDQRAEARANKDWGTADRIRDAIAAAGIALEDTPDGTHWSIDG